MSLHISCGSQREPGDAQQLETQRQASPAQANTPSGGQSQASAQTHKLKMQLAEARAERDKLLRYHECVDDQRALWLGKSSPARSLTSVGVLGVFEPREKEAREAAETRKSPAATIMQGQSPADLRATLEAARKERDELLLLSQQRKQRSSKLDTLGMEFRNRFQTGPTTPLGTPESKRGLFLAPEPEEEQVLGKHLQSQADQEEIEAQRELHEEQEKRRAAQAELELARTRSADMRQEIAQARAQVEAQRQAQNRATQPPNNYVLAGGDDQDDEVADAAWRKAEGLPSLAAERAYTYSSVLPRSPLMRAHAHAFRLYGAQNSA